MDELKKYLRIISYLKPYKWIVLLSIVSSLLVASSLAGAIGGIKPFVDLLTGQLDLSQYRKLPFMDTPLGEFLLNTVESFLTVNRSFALMIFVLIIVALACLRAVFKFVQGYTGGYLANRMRMDVSIELHDKIMDQSISFFSKQGVGNTISVFSYDINLIHQGAKIVFDKIVLEPLNIIVGLTLAFILNPKLALMAIVGFPIIGYAINRFGRQIKKSTRRSLKNRASILSLLQETFFGIKIVKSFVMDDYERERFNKENEKLLKNTMRAVRAHELVSPVVEVVAAVGIGLFILLGGRDVLSGEMSPGSFAAFYIALGSIFNPLRILAKSVGEIQTSLAGAVRTFDFMDHLPEVKDVANAAEMPKIKGRVSFQNVSFSYDSKKMVIKDVSFEAEPGENVALVGVSGAGKSTLINLLLRFYDPQEGRICIDDIDIRSVAQNSLRAQIGLVTQEIILFNDSVANNIAFGRNDFSRDQIVAAAKAANAHEFIEELPDGYDTIIGERGMLLSGGQRQRLAIARTILKNPSIFILDEATSSLDSKNEALIQEALARLIEGRTTFVIAHRLSTIQNADKIVVLDHGRIDAIGPHRTLYSTSPIYRSLYEKQFLAPPESVQVG